MLDELGSSAVHRDPMCLLNPGRKLQKGLQPAESPKFVRRITPSCAVRHGFEHRVKWGL